MPQTISTTVNGTLVQGTITHYQPYDISVEITEPFSGFSAGCHIPYFARGHKNYKGEKGHKKAVELLTGLYRDLVAVNSQKTQLQEKLKGLVEANQATLDEQAGIMSQKASLKKQFKNKEIGQTAYQSALKSLRESDFSLHCAMDTAKMKFAEENMPGLRFMGTDQLYDYLMELQN